MAARLVSRSGAFEGLDVRFGSELAVGRDPANTLVLPDSRISTRHARIYRETGPDGAGGAYWLEDLGSRNGTFVDGLPVREPERLHGLAVVRFGPEGEFLFQSEAPEALPAAHTLGGLEAPVLPAGLAGDQGRPKTAIGEAPPALPAALLPPAALPPAPVLRRPLRVESDEGPAERFELAPGVNVVGRDPACEISIHHATLSRRHAAIEIKEDRVFLTDLGSTNGTHLGERKLFPNLSTEWPPGVVAHIGGLRAEWWEELQP
jgi:pSer/pThr/pTyr-binding forkhead associated (FHA) protein